MSVTRRLSVAAALGRTALLSARKASDVRRWRDSRELSPQWFGRSVVAAKHIPAGASVIEFGAGQGRLGELLTADCEYQPSDLVKREPTYLVIDLNDQWSVPRRYDVAVLLGVVEYLHDPGAVFRRLRDVARRLILTYCATTPTASRLDRRSRGWVNDMSEEHLVVALGRAGFTVTTTEEIELTRRYRQILAVCEATDGTGGHGFAEPSEGGH